MGKQILIDRNISRRSFIVNTGNFAIGAFLLPHLAWAKEFSEIDIIKSCGSASKYTPKLMAAFVRRKGEYGMWWPGQIYDGEAAFIKYKQQILETEKKLNVKISLN